MNTKPSYLIRQKMIAVKTNKMLLIDAQRKGDTFEINRLEKIIANLSSDIQIDEERRSVA